MRAARLILVGAVIALGSVLCAASSVLSEDVPRMSKEELKNLLGNPDVIVIDVRQESDWERSDSKIKGAVRETPDEAEFWMKKYAKDKW